MKKQIALLQWLIIAMGISVVVKGQPAYTLKLNYDTLSGNNVSALFTPDGTLNFTPAGNDAYRVPKTGAACSIFCGSLWIGGIDAGKQLHTAAETYYQNGTDFWPGPIMDSLNYCGHQDTIWDRVYRVDRSTIDSFKNGLFGSNIPRSILGWPGRGDTSLGEMPQLAPYVDISKSGFYNPVNGDYPLIRGDEAAYMIYTDARISKHTESRGLKFGIEVHLMAYQFNSTDAAVNEATFLHYDIYNRSQNTYDSVYVGNFIDMDIGNGGDDYVGCDTVNNYWYTYNGEAVDAASSTGYDSLPPAQALLYLCDTMKHFQYYYNNFSTHGNPLYPQNYYDYLKSIWPDSIHAKYYDTTSVNTNFAYSGNPVTGLGWSEVSAKKPMGDMRGLSSVGPFTFAPGGCKSIDVALVFAQNMVPGPTANLQSVALLANNITDVKNFYNTQTYGCDSGLLALNEIKQNVPAVIVYPNPSSNGRYTVGIKNYELGITNVEVYNILGETVHSELSTIHSQLSIDISNEPNGLYFYRITDKNGEQVSSGKMIIQK